MKLTSTKQIEVAVGKWRELHGDPDAEKIGDDWIDHRFLAQVSSALDQPLFRLVQGTAVYIPPAPPKPAKSPGFIKLMERLRAEAQEKEYRELAGIKDETGPMFGGSDTKQVKEELTTILNFAVSVFAVGFALWYWAKWWDPASRTLLAVLGALVVLVAEVVVYASYRSKIDEARRLEKTAKHTTKIAEPVANALAEPEKTIADIPKIGPAKKTGKKKRQKKKNASATTTGSVSTDRTLRSRITAS